ncbi:MAG: hypothetical protein M1833_005692 [Piccolia ochrophora]|nr:MAG: hypothetical protein M1833_005692 [Piccolia ochrophora]
MAPLLNSSSTLPISVLQSSTPTTGLNVILPTSNTTFSFQGYSNVNIIKPTHELTSPSTPFVSPAADSRSSPLSSIPTLIIIPQSSQPTTTKPCSLLTTYPSPPMADTTPLLARDFLNPSTDDLTPLAPPTSNEGTDKSTEAAMTSTKGPWWTNVWISLVTLALVVYDVGSALVVLWIVGRWLFFPTRDPSSVRAQRRAERRQRAGEMRWVMRLPMGRL